MIVCSKIRFTSVFLLVQSSITKLSFVSTLQSTHQSVMANQSSVKETFVFMIDELSILRDTPPEQVERSPEVIEMHSYRLEIKLAPPNSLFLYIDCTSFTSHMHLLLHQSKLGSRPGY